MTTTKHTRRLNLPRRAPGLGLVELMLSLTIMALLLTSVAAAFHASARTVEENQKVTTVTHNARIVLNRLMAQVRRANWIIYDGAVDPAWMPEIEIEPIDGPTVIKYELVNGTLWYRETLGGVKSYAILGSDEGVTVHDFIVGFKGEDVLDEDGVKVDFMVTFVTVDLDVEVDGNRLMLTASTIPRRNRDW